MVGPAPVRKLVPHRKGRVDLSEGKWSIIKLWLNLTAPPLSSSSQRMKNQQQCFEMQSKSYGAAVAVVADGVTREAICMQHQGDSFP